MAQDNDASADADRALLAPLPEPASSLGPTGDDPSRVLAEMDRYLAEAGREGKRPKLFRVSENLLRDLSKNGARLANYRGVPITCANEWSWGWMLLVHKDMFAWEEHWFTPRADHREVLP